MAAFCASGSGSSSGSQITTEPLLSSSDRVLHEPPSDRIPLQHPEPRRSSQPPSHCLESRIHGLEPSQRLHPSAFRTDRRIRLARPTSACPPECRSFLV